MADDIRVERGWIYVNATKLDDGRVQMGTGNEIKLSPADAVQDRQELAIPAGAIVKASVQRLAFWRR